MRPSVHATWHEELFRDDKIPKSAVENRLGRRQHYGNIQLNSFVLALRADRLASAPVSG